MKKIVVLLLVVLPIFLLVAVSVAGMVLSKMVHISVESITFVNENEEKITEVSIEKDAEHQLFHKILPLQATDKVVTYISSKPQTVKITQDGFITGLAYGMSTIIITTRDGGKTAQILVKVTDEKVSSVTLSRDDATLRIGEQITLTAMVLPTTAINKDREWSSSDSSVAKVDTSGRVTAVSEGVATIIVTTVDGGKTDTCVITVIDETPVLSFIDLGGSSTYKSLQNSVDMRDVIRHNENISFEEITLKIIAGSAYASLENGILVFQQQGRSITVIATVVFEGDVYEASMDFVWLIG